jgi:hypothetical protein
VTIQKLPERALPDLFLPDGGMIKGIPLEEAMPHAAKWVWKKRKEVLELTEDYFNKHEIKEEI